MSKLEYKNEGINSRPIPHYPNWSYFCPECEKPWESQLERPAYFVPCPECNLKKNGGEERDCEFCGESYVFYPKEEKGYKSYRFCCQEHQDRYGDAMKYLEDSDSKIREENSWGNLL